MDGIVATLIVIVSHTRVVTSYLRNYAQLEQDILVVHAADVAASLNCWGLIQGKLNMSLPS